MDETVLIELRRIASALERIADAITTQKVKVRASPEQPLNLTDFYDLSRRALVLRFSGVFETHFGQSGRSRESEEASVTKLCRAIVRDCIREITQKGYHERHVLSEAERTRMEAVLEAVDPTTVDPFFYRNFGVLGTAVIRKLQVRARA